MNKKLSFILLLLFSISFILVSTAEAKRFGGGYSFGGKKSYSSPYKKSSQNSTFTQQKSAAQQKAATSNQQRKQQFASRGGLMGMLGGLALGGLLGALFFGGAFEGFNFFDFVIIGGVILLLMWWMKRKGPAAKQPSSATAGAYDMNMGAPSTRRVESKTLSDKQLRQNPEQTDADFADHFDDPVKAEQNPSTSSKQTTFAESFGMDYGHANTQSISDSANEIILPDWFNQDEFLSKARSAYAMLQEAWDNGDMATIRNLTTDSVYAEITRQFAQQASQGPTRITQLSAELIDFQQLDHQTEAAVLFDALVAETDDLGNQGRTGPVKELWHFIRAQNSTEPTWYLDGIQQLE